VLIEVETVGANAIDSLFRSGDGPWRRPLPGALTGEVVGRIAQLGPAAPPGLELGQRVGALSEDAYAEYVVADAAWLAPVPEDADPAEATVLPMTAPLALRILKAGRLTTGDTVLIHSAAGTIGHLAVQLAKLLGASTIIGTASSEAKRAFATGNGADHTVSSADADWAEQVRQLAPDGIDVVLDSIGGSVFEHGVGLLSPFGRMVTYGAISGDLPTVSGTALYGTLGSVTGLSMLALRKARPDLGREDITQTTRYWRDGRLRPSVHGRYPLDRTAEVHQVIEARSNQGRLVTTV
jgi:NADPH2:quinone reductase